MNRQFRTASIIAAAACASGCAVHVHDNQLDGTPAYVKLARHSTSAWICKGQRQLALGVGADGYAAIPSGQRLTIGGTERAGNRICHSSRSFVPVSGQRYVLDVQPYAERCYFTLVIENPKAINGIVLVQTTAPEPNACAGTGGGVLYQAPM